MYVESLSERLVYTPDPTPRLVDSWVLYHVTYVKKVYQRFSDRSPTEEVFQTTTKEGRRTGKILGNGTGSWFQSSCHEMTTNLVPWTYGNDTVLDRSPRLREDVEDIRVLDHVPMASSSIDTRPPGTQGLCPTPSL